MPKDFVRVLGVKVSTFSPEKAFEKIISFISSPDQHYVVTPNPEILLKAQKNEHFYHALNNADLALPDGMGIKLALWLQGKNLKRITGVDVSLKLLEFCEKNNVKVGILNWQSGLSSATEISEALKAKHPKLDFLAIDIHREWKLGDYEALNRFEPQLIFVTLGNPYQEIFLYDYLKKLPYVRLGLAVGSTFDYLTGKAVRAPKLFRRLGCEWLWRAFSSPQGQKTWKKTVRLKRIFNAFVVFPLAFFRYKYIRPFQYRPNVACLLYKKTDRGVKVFFLQRSDDKDHWQIPQGGLDGEGLQTAAYREIVEEAGVRNFRIKKIKNNVHSYAFLDKKERAKRFGYKGQKQALAIAEFTGSDKEINIKPYNHKNWQWVSVQEAKDFAHPCRQEAMQKFLYIFENYLEKNEN